jgi:hypothetical protein
MVCFLVLSLTEREEFIPLIGALVQHRGLGLEVRHLLPQGEAAQVLGPVLRLRNDEPLGG